MPKIWTTRAFNELTQAARSYALPSRFSKESQGIFLLMRAATTFTIQLAHDTANRLTVEMSSLTDRMLTKLDRNPDESVRCLCMLHDMDCVIGDLSHSASRHSIQHSWESSLQLAVMAITFTIQLAIEETGSAAPKMRELAKVLISRVKASWPLDTFPLSVPVESGPLWET